MEMAQIKRDVNARLHAWVGAARRSRQGARSAPGAGRRTAKDVQGGADDVRDAAVTVARDVSHVNHAVRAEIAKDRATCEVYITRKVHRVLACTLFTTCRPH